MFALLLACQSGDQPHVAHKQPERPDPQDVPHDSTPHEDGLSPEIRVTREFPDRIPRVVPDRMVVMVVVDGVRVEEFSSDFVSDMTGLTGQEWTPAVWAELAPQSTVVRAAIIPGITSTGPSHVTLLTGATPAMANLPTGPGNITLYRPEIPSLIQFAQQFSSTLFMGNTHLLNDVGGTIYPGFMGTGDFISVSNPDTDEAVLDAALASILSHPPALTVLNLHEVDIQGHMGDDGEYGSQVQLVDASVVEFFQQLQADPEIAERLLFVLTSDHGRHRSGNLTPIWMEHGDACSGCREVPLFLSGPGIPAGQELELLWTEQDTNQLVSEWLGVDNPFGQGLLANTLLPGASARSGAIGVSVSREHTAVQVWQDDPEHRSRIEVDGEVISSPTATFAERPIMEASKDRLAVCWRELTIDPEEDWWPWVPRCMMREKAGEEWGIWVDIGFIVPEVSHSFKPTLVWSGQTTPESA